MKYIACLSLFALTTSLVIPISAQANPSGNNGHSLIDPYLQKSLKSLGIKIALPQYVPQGFRVATIKSEPCPAGTPVNANGVCRFRPNYAVLYRNAQNQCFAVNAIGGGIGGPTGRYTRVVNTKILGKVDVNVDTGNGQTMTAAIAKTPQKHLWTFPAGNSPYYQVTTIEGKNWISSTITCSNRAYMTPNEFIKIVQSLEWLP